MKKKPQTRTYVSLRRTTANENQTKNNNIDMCMKQQKQNI